MIWQSMAAMAVIDLIVLGMAGLMGVYLWRQRAHLKGPRQFGSLFLIFAGMSLIGLFYLIDLASMTVLPKLIAMSAAMQFRSTLHLNIHWMVTLLAAPLIIIGFIGTIRRQAELVSQLEATQATLADSADRMSSILDLAADGILSVGLDGDIRRVNQAALSMFAINPEDISQANINDLVQTVDRDGNHGPVLQVVGEGAEELQVARGEGAGIRRDGREFPVAYAVSGFFVHGERMYTIIVSDVTESRRLEEAMQMSQKMEALGRLAGGIAHDFNNLLAVVLGSTELASSYLSEDSPAIEELDHVERAVQRAASLTKQLLAFSRHQGFDPHAFDLGVMISELEPMLQRTIGDRIRFKFHAGYGSNVVSADPAQMEQLLLSLVINARDAIEEDGEISIGMESVNLDEEFLLDHPGIRPGYFTVISIADTGVGMDTETQKHIFEPFFSTKKGGEGSGLGLSTAHGVVSKAGGIITLDSEPGRGTTFHIYLPISKEQPEERGPSKASHLLPVSGAVLLAEDRESVRRMVSTILMRAGYECHSADSGVTALETFKKDPNGFDVVLTDVLMPGMGGVELAKHIREIRPEVPILFMSGYADSSQISQNDVADNIELMHKPFTRKEILGKLREVLKTGT